MNKIILVSNFKVCQILPALEQDKENFWSEIIFKIWKHLLCSINMDNIKRNSQENHFVINFINDIHFVSANLIYIGLLDTEIQIYGKCVRLILYNMN